MGALKQGVGRIRAFFHKQAHDSELEAEVSAHLDLAIEENIRRGMSPAEARRQALLRFGGVQRAREEQRETRGLPWLDILGQDLRFTLRTLRRDRAFAIVAVLILGLGIGANIVVFSVVNTIPIGWPPPDFPSLRSWCGSRPPIRPAANLAGRTPPTPARNFVRGTSPFKM